MALRRIQLLLRSTARRLTRSTFRPSSAASSSSMAMWSSRLHSASGAKVTSTSTSLSGRKSSRSTEPKRDSSTIFHRWQNAATFSGSIAILVFISVILCVFSLYRLLRLFLHHREQVALRRVRPLPDHDVAGVLDDQRPVLLETAGVDLDNAPLRPRLRLPLL